MRIDPAHLYSAGAEQMVPARIEQGHVAGLGSVPSLHAGETAVAAQHLRTQAVQLGDHLAQRQDDMERREAQLDARAAETESALEKARLWFSQREADLLRLRQRWIEEQRQAKAELEASRRQHDEERRRDWAELQEKRRSLERRAEEVDGVWTAIQRLHEEVLRTHRETLQLRLAQEELRAELAPLVPADVQRRALEQIRARLSEEYRKARLELSRQKRDLLAVRRDLAEQHRTMAQDRDRLLRLAASAAAKSGGPRPFSSCDRGAARSGG